MSRHKNIEHEKCPECIPFDLCASVPWSVVPVSIVPVSIPGSNLGSIPEKIPGSIPVRGIYSQNIQFQL